MEKPYNSALLLLSLIFCIHSAMSVSLLKEVSKTGLRHIQFDHTPLCFNSKQSFQLRDGNLSIMSKQPYMWTEGDYGNISTITAADVYPEAAEAAIDSMYVTDSSYVALGITSAAVVCVLDSNSTLINCITGPTSFGSTLYLDKNLGMLLIGAPALNTFFLSLWNEESGTWSEATEVQVNDIPAEAAFGSSIVCVDSVCAVGAPLADEGRGIIYVLSYDHANHDWNQLCSLQNIEGFKGLGSVLYAIQLSKDQDIMLLQTTTAIGESMLSVIYKINVREQTCMSSIPGITGSISKSPVCAVCGMETLCIDRTG